MPSGRKSALCYCRNCGVKTNEVLHMAWVYSREVVKALDWFGRKLVHLIDHSDFFAGCVVTAAVISLWELLTK